MTDDFPHGHPEIAPTDDERNKAIWRAVVEECQGHNGGAPHATTWARGGYRNDVPTLCDRCARLIETLQSLPAFRRSEVPEPTRQIRECAVCGEKVTMSNATDEWEKRHKHAATQSEPSDAQVDDALSTYKGYYREDDGPGDPSRKAMRAALRRSEADREPSDAQVLAALRSFWGQQQSYSMGQRGRMRAALRAAQEVER